MRTGTAKLLWVPIIVVLVLGNGVVGVGAPDTSPIDTFLLLYGKGNLHHVIDMDVFALIKAIGVEPDEFAYGDRSGSTFVYGLGDSVEAGRTATRTGVVGMVFTEYQYKISTVSLLFSPSLPVAQVLQILGYPDSLTFTEDRTRVGSTPYQTFTTKLGTRTLSLTRDHLTDAIWRAYIWASIY